MGDLGAARREVVDGALVLDDGSRPRRSARTQIRVGGAAGTTTLNFMYVPSSCRHDDRAVGDDPRRLAEILLEPLHRVDRLLDDRLV